MNAITFLIQEHDKVRQAFSEISKKSHRDATKQKLFTQLCEDLISHELMEEKIWYPRFKNSDQLEDTVKHLISEEKHAAKAIKEFDNIKSEKEWEEKFLKLKDAVEHHAKEEEDQLFPNVEKILDEEQLKKIGNDMKEFKKNLLAQLEQIS